MLVGHQDQRNAHKKLRIRLTNNNIQDFIRRVSTIEYFLGKPTIFLLVYRGLSVLCNSQRNAHKTERIKIKRDKNRILCNIILMIVYLGRRPKFDRDMPSQFDFSKDSVIPLFLELSYSFSREND